VKPFVGKQVEPRSVPGRGFNYSDWGSCRACYMALQWAHAGDISMSLSVGAFLHSRAKAMTSWLIGVTVCESLREGNWRCVRVSTSVTARGLLSRYQCTDWLNFSVYAEYASNACVQYCCRDERCLCGTFCVLHGKSA
jgi:hypothetical protein